MRRWFGILAVWLLLTSLAAQELACPAAPADIWTSLVGGCEEQMIGSLCYGHPTVSAVFQQNQGEDVRFLLPGDRIPLTDIDWFSVSSEAGTWGAARALFHAYPADGLDARTAAMIFFGDLALFLPAPTDSPAPLLDVEVRAAAGANFRTQPRETAKVIRVLAYEAPLKAIGRRQDWARVYADPTTAAWVSQSLLSGDISGLPLLPADPPPASPLWLPLQNFDFHSGLDDAPCGDLPASGILIQTPTDAAPRRFEINGTRLYLNGTAFLQAQIQTGLLVHVLAGEARLEALDGEATLNPGAVSRVPLGRDDTGSIFPTESPAAPQAYDYHRLLNLPLDLLPQPARVGLDVYALVSRRPADGSSPIAGMALDAPCTFTTGQSGANIRARPDPEAMIIGAMGYRESAQPAARAVGSDGLPWWQLAESVWIRIDATVTGGDCRAVPFIDISPSNP